MSYGDNVNFILQQQCLKKDGVAGLLDVSGLVWPGVLEWCKDWKTEVGREVCREVFGREEGEGREVRGGFKCTEWCPGGNPQSSGAEGLESSQRRK